MANVVSVEYRGNAAAFSKLMNFIVCLRFTLVTPQL